MKQIEFIILTLVVISLGLQLYGFLTRKERYSEAGLFGQEGAQVGMPVYDSKDFDPASLFATKGPTQGPTQGPNQLFLDLGLLDLGNNVVYG